MSDGPKKTINKITKGFAKHGYICSDQIYGCGYLITTNIHSRIFSF